MEITVSILVLAGHVMVRVTTNDGETVHSQTSPMSRVARQIRSMRFSKREILTILDGDVKVAEDEFDSPILL